MPGSWKPNPAFLKKKGVQYRELDVHAEKWKHRFSYNKWGMFRGYLPASGFRECSGNLKPPAKREGQPESTHDKEVRQLMEVPPRDTSESTARRPPCNEALSGARADAMLLSLSGGYHKEKQDQTGPPPH